MIVGIIRCFRVYDKRLRKSRQIITKCDACEKLCKFAFSSQILKQATHSCSKKCNKIMRSRGGALFEKMMDGRSKHPAQTIKAKLKRKNTVKKRYGVANVAKSEQSKKSARKTFMKKYGVTTPFKAPWFGKRSRATRKKNARFRSSKPEDAMYEYLCCLYGSKNVSRWVIKNGWEIDAYVSSIDTYFQLDGVYWHGLDRAASCLGKSQKKQRLRDSIQNNWFSSNEMNLIRYAETAYYHNGVFDPSLGHIVFVAQRIEIRNQGYYVE